MKTTLDLNDDLAKQAKAAAKREGTTLRALVERGIRLVLEDSGSEPYRLPDKSVGGQGLQDHFRDRGWGEIREAAYEYSGH